MLASIHDIENDNKNVCIDLCRFGSVQSRLVPFDLTYFGPARTLVAGCGFVVTSDRSGISSILYYNAWV